MRSLNRRLHFRYLALAMAAIGADPAAAQPYPSRPLRLIVPAGAGSNLDFRARQLAQKVAAALRQPIVIDNRPGANSIIGTELATRAPADGHTLFAGYHATVMNPHLYAKLPYDVSRQLVPIVLVNTSWIALHVHPSVSAQSVPQLVQLARSRSNDLLCGSTGNGSGQHLACHLFGKLSGAVARPVLYREASFMLTDLVGGKTQLYFDALTGLLPLVKAGKLNTLAICGPSRLNSLPRVPTFRESGMADFELSFWHGIWTRAGVPAEATDLLNRRYNAALQEPDVLEHMRDTGATPMGGSSAQFEQFLVAESAKWARIIRDAGVRLD